MTNPGDKTPRFVPHYMEEELPLVTFAIMDLWCWQIGADVLWGPWSTYCSLRWLVWGSLRVAPDIDPPLCVLEASDQDPGEAPEMFLMAVCGEVAGQADLAMGGYTHRESRRLGIFVMDDYMAPRVLVPNPECTQTPWASRFFAVKLLLISKLPIKLVSFFFFFLASKFWHDLREKLGRAVDATWSLMSAAALLKLLLSAARLQI